MNVNRIDFTRQIGDTFNLREGDSETERGLCVFVCVFG